MSKELPLNYEKGRSPDAKRRKLQLIDELRARMRQMNERLAQLDVHDVQTAEEQAAFWDACIIEAEGVIKALHRIVQLQGGSGRERMLRYLISHVGDPVEVTTLAAVSVVLDWGRRVRELVDQLGYEIATSKTDPSLKPGQYRLVSTTPKPRARQP